MAVFRNVATVMALLVALQAASAMPANKDGEGKGKGKGRRAVEEASALGGSLAEALAEEPEAALVLEEQLRVRRAVEAQEEQPQGDALVQDEQAQPLAKKPCRGNRNNGGGGSGGGGTDAGTGNGTDTETVGEAGDMQRQQAGKQRKGKGGKSGKSGKNKKGSDSGSTADSSALANWMAGDALEDTW